MKKHTYVALHSSIFSVSTVVGANRKTGACKQSVLTTGTTNFVEIDRSTPTTDSGSLGCKKQNVKQK